MQPERLLRLSRRSQERLSHSQRAQGNARSSSILSATPAFTASVCLTTSLCCCSCI
jgi:hypothetical protein